MNITEALGLPDMPTRGQIAEEVGISLSQFSRIENGQSKTALDKAEAIARQLRGEINPFDLIDRKGRKSRKGSSTCRAKVPEAAPPE